MCFSVQVDQDVKKLSGVFNATYSQRSVDHLLKMKQREMLKSSEQMRDIFGLKRKPKTTLFKTVDEKNSRIYPGTFANVIVAQGNQKRITQMRYRVRPHGSLEEIPSKYNVFNARLDSLEKRKTWSGLFGQKHALLPFKSFYEWIDRDGTSALIKFKPEHGELMWAPCLYDEWFSVDGEFSFRSFALITMEPPPEIQAIGHDRCPIYLKKDLIDSWLNPETLSKSDLYHILSQIESTTYQYQFAAQ